MIGSHRSFELAVRRGRGDQLVLGFQGHRHISRVETDSRGELLFTFADDWEPIVDDGPGFSDLPSASPQSVNQRLLSRSRWWQCLQTSDG